MKFTLSWLKEHLETDATLQEITDKLTAIGLELEGVEDPSEGLEPFLVGHVISAEQHPNADRLRCCIVDNGTDHVNVVCGAPNARAGIKVVFAPVGTYVPGIDMTLKAGVIRDEPSNGMMCSERELEISDEHDGIIELPDDAPIGSRYVDYKGLTDPVIEIAITPNRGDCLGVRGVARDLAAAGLGTLKDLPILPVEGNFESPIQWAIEDDGNACPHVKGRTFRNVKNGPSPQWLQDRLTAIGLRPISTLVDITNYVSFDMGRPLHVFDADKLEGNQLTMRVAKDGESMVALDDETYSLDAGMTVIADAKGPQGIGGIMGGLESGCTDETTNVFLEVASFAPIKIAETGRKLGIESDARYRFERTVDPDSVNWGMDVATQLILGLCAGEASSISEAGSKIDTSRDVSLRTERLKSHGGTDIADEDAQNILNNLGFETRLADGVITAAVPSWRPDIEGEHCLVEEVLRINGLDKIEAQPLPREKALSGLAITQPMRRVSFAKKTLATRGMYEAVTYSFMDGEKAALFGDVNPALRLANPISSDLDLMRPSIVPNLLAAAAKNVDRGIADLAIFEVGPIFLDPTPKGQSTVVTAIRVGKTGPRHWSETPRAIDAYDLKADAEAVLEACGAPVGNLQISGTVPSYYHPGRSAALGLGKNILAVFGELHPKQVKAMGLKGRAFAMEVYLDKIPMPKSKGTKSKGALKVSNLQAVNRDFAFLVARDVAAADVARAAMGADKKLLTAANVFDLYEGEELGDEKSIAITVTLQPTDTTLTDKEIEAVSEKIVAAVAKRTQGRLRG